MNLKNKIVVITGASRGIGKEIARLLAENGAIVVLMGRSESELTKLSYDIGKEVSSTYTLDISDQEAVNKSIQEVLQKYGRIDVLINNAGVGFFKRFDDFSESEWNQMMDTNVKGTFLVTKQVVSQMKKQKSGHILTIASDVSKRTFSEGSIYCASKYAQDALMATLRKEIRPFGVKVSLVYPGLVDTYFGNTKMGENHKKDWLKPVDIANSVLHILNAPDHVVIDELTIHPLSQEY